MNRPFVLEHTYDAPIETVWQALSQTDKLKQWYFPQLTEFKPEIGFDFKFRDDGSTYKKEWKVTNVVAGHKLAHTWVYKGYPGMSEVTFELFEEGAKTRLTLPIRVWKHSPMIRILQDRGLKTVGPGSSALT